MLLGAGIFWDLLRCKRETIGKNLFAQETILRWIVAGSIAITKMPIKINCHTNYNKNRDKIDIQKQLETFWLIEEGETQQIKSESLQFCETHFRDNYQKDRSGRFIVSIPFQQPLNLLGDTEQIARKRFFNLERKLLRNQELRTKYCEFMKEYEDLNHMSEIKASNSEAPSYFIPHHGVLNENSRTTKLRVVFDASCPSSTEVLLNDLQAVGPVIQNDLLNILLRFRTYAVAISADITKMYRQILLAKNERSLQQIFWRKSLDVILKTYQLNTVTYGTASASFLAIRCLIQLANDSETKFPKSAEKIRSDFYVDDLLTGCETIDEAKNLVNEIDEILKGGCLPLRKWLSNKPSIFTHFPRGNENLTVNLSEDENSKTLGVYWEPNNDNFKFQVGIIKIEHATKRNVLSAIGQIFDPLGLLSPFIIRAKVFLQVLWQGQLEWDEVLGEELKKQWDEIQNDFNILSNIKIPRRITVSGKVKFEIHGFSDASERAYGACVYLRSMQRDGQIIVRLIASRSRLAPLKSQTIPRLEFCAALFLVKLFEKVNSSLKLPIEEVFLWSDSNVVLAWLRTQPNLLKTFVTNRVIQIVTLTEGCTWFTWLYVPTNDNPADLISRGTSANKLRKTSLWWVGPVWLGKTCKGWPTIEPVVDIEVPELRPIKLAFIASGKVVKEELIARFSNYVKAKRVFAIIYRAFIKRKKPFNEILIDRVEELERAEQYLVKNTQYIFYETEMHILKGGKQLPRTSELTPLRPFLDQEGILRVGGRLKYSNLHFAQKHPIILPPKGKLTRLLLEHEHSRLGHAGPSQLLYSIRERFWPINGRNLVRSVVHKCIPCFKANPINFIPAMGNLPSERIKESFTFECVGIDYAGPFFIKQVKGRGGKRYKGYLAVFVCFFTKACHLEIVSDLTTEAFIAALKRFVSRRGKPSQIWSDSGTNFVGAERELRDIIELIKKGKDKLTSFLNTEGIHWRFIPVSAPHFGGLWESAVRRAKFHLKRMVGDMCMTMEEFSTLTCQVESILNSRPLAPLSHHPEDLEPLTPGHFLIRRSLVSLPELDYGKITESRLSRFQLLQQKMQSFWKRWSREYLPELQRRTKWFKNKGPSPQVGDLVLIKAENTAPLQWPLGRILELHQAADGVARVASLRYRGGITRRPIVKLFPLPTSAAAEEEPI